MASEETMLDIEQDWDRCSEGANTVDDIPTERYEVDWNNTSVYDNKNDTHWNLSELAEFMNDHKDGNEVLKIVEEFYYDGGRKELLDKIYEYVGGEYSG